MLSTHPGGKKNAVALRSKSGIIKILLLRKTKPNETLDSPDFFFQAFLSNCLNWKFTALIILHFRKIYVVGFCLYDLALRRCPLVSIIEKFPFRVWRQLLCKLLW